MNKTASGNKLLAKFAWIYSILNGSVNETHIDAAFFRCQICKFMTLLLPSSSCLSSLFTKAGSRCHQNFIFGNMAGFFFLKITWKQCAQMCAARAARFFPHLTSLNHCSNDNVTNQWYDLLNMENKRAARAARTFKFWNFTFGQDREPKAAYLSFCVLISEPFVTIKWNETHFLQHGQHGIIA